MDSRAGVLPGAACLFCGGLLLSRRWLAARLAEGTQGFCWWRGPLRALCFACQQHFNYQYFARDSGCHAEYLSGLTPTFPRLRVTDGNQVKEQVKDLDGDLWQLQRQKPSTGQVFLVGRSVAAQRSAAEYARRYLALPNRDLRAIAQISSVE